MCLKVKSWQREWNTLSADSLACHLIINSIEKENLKVAEKDIKVWKVLNNDFSAPIYRSFQYVPLKVYKTKMMLHVRDYQSVVVEEGFHSFTSRKSAEVSHLSPRHNMGKIVEFVVPKGANYYVSDDQIEIASDRIMMRTNLLLYWLRRLRRLFGTGSDEQYL